MGSRLRGGGAVVGAVAVAAVASRWECGPVRDRGGPEADSGRIVLLAGDAGIGKTTLSAELARRVHDAGAIVLAGRSPRETVVPYQPFLESLRHWAMNAQLTDLRASTREYGSELARLIPELRRRAPDLPPPPQDEPETERYRLFEAVVGLLTELSRSAPVLLVLDDLQWADRPTLLLLRHLARAHEPGAPADPGRVPRGRAPGRYVHERARRASPRPARLAARHQRAERVRDGRAGSGASGGEPGAGVRPGAVRGDRGQSVLRRGDDPASDRGRRPGRQRQRVRAPAIRAARGRQAGDRPPPRPARCARGRVAARRRRDRP